MAVYAAHLTRTLQGTPSVFEITAQEALGATVKPALRKLIEYLSEVYPGKCGWCRHWFDELYLLFDYFLQYNYLKHYAASFSESFYGLLRVPISPSGEFSTGTRLPHTIENASLALLVLVPYLSDKLEKLIEKWKDDLESGRLGKSKLDQARKAAVKLYSIMYFVTEASKLVVLARYLTGGNKSPSLNLYLLGLTLKSAPPEEESESSWKEWLESIYSGDIFRQGVRFPALARGLGRAGAYGLFGVQLVRWWGARAPALAALPAPPPPQKDERALRLTNICPICLQRWKVPTVLPVSGYVYCYVCISRQLRARAQCPHSRLPASEADLRRLYLDQD